MFEKERHKHALADSEEPRGVQHRWIRPIRCLKHTHTHTFVYVSVLPRKDAVCASDVPENAWMQPGDRENCRWGASLEWGRGSKSQRCFAVMETKPLEQHQYCKSWKTYEGKSTLETGCVTISEALWEPGNAEMLTDSCYMKSGQKS